LLTAIFYSFNYVETLFEDFPRASSQVNMRGRCWPNKIGSDKINFEPDLRQLNLKPFHIPSNFPRKKLGLCMIVRNESRALGQCLDSVRDWVAEMIVVDTGSTDETVTIARDHGATVGHFPWCDDFSAARNAALSQATREWVLVLDGDETCHINNAADFAHALQQTKYDGFSLPISSLNDDGTHSQAMVFRLFRRTLPDMRYRGEIHEQLVAVAEGKVRTSSLSCIRLSHDGYTTAVFTSKDKSSRNILLSRKVAQSRPNDPFSWFVLAMALTHSDPDGMLEAARTAFTMLEVSQSKGRGEQYVVNLYLAAIGVHISRGQTNEAMVLADQGLTIFPDSPDLHYQRGGNRMSTGDFAGAAEDFAAALTLAGSKFMLIVDPAAIGHGSRTGLAQALNHMNRSEEAIHLLRTAITESPPAYAYAHAELGSLLLQRGALEQAAPILKEAFRRDPKDDGVAFNLAWCLYRWENFAGAEDILRGRNNTPKSQHLLARIFLNSGKAEQALRLVTASPLPEALLTLGWTHCVLGHAELASSAWDSWDAHISAESLEKSALAMFRFLLSNAPAFVALNEGQVESIQKTDAWLHLLLRYQRNEDVVRALHRAPLLGPAVWPALRMRWAQSLVLGGHTDLGVPLLIEAANDNPDDGAAFYWLGYCAMLRQQPEDARLMFCECLRCEPQHPQASQALALLN
jgi:tetratricopeptide (TPR) repeat protein